jgi:hypothetical protein
MWVKLSNNMVTSYTKLPTIVHYKIGYVKGKPSEEKYLVLTSMRVSIVLLSVNLARSRISTINFD